MDRIVRNQSALLSTTFVNDETPVDADGTVTVTVKRADGTTLASGNASLAGAGTGTYTFSLSPQATLNKLTVTWSGTFSAQPRSQVTTVEIAGAHYFTLKELRDYDSALSNTDKYPTIALKRARLEVEDEFERFCERAFVYRFHRQAFRVSLEGTSDEIWLRKPEPKEILTFTMDGVDMLPLVSDGTIQIDESNPHLMFHTNGYFRGDIVLEYEYGRDIEPPRDLVAKAKQRARGNLTGLRSRIDERATMMQVPDLGTFRLSTPGRGGAMTGIPEIDVVLSDYMLGASGGGVTVA